MKKRFGGRRIRVYLALLSLMLYVFTKISVMRLALCFYRGFDHVIYYYSTMEGRYISPLSELLWFLITAVYNRCPIVHLQMVCYRLYSLCYVCVCILYTYAC